MDPNLVVFESGLGKQYADSPRYIYEELSGAATLDQVWVYARYAARDATSTPTSSSGCSPSSTYLARAQYWVNNQSFPRLFTRRREDDVHPDLARHAAQADASTTGRGARPRPRLPERGRPGTSRSGARCCPQRASRPRRAQPYRYDGRVLETGFPRNDLLAAGTATERVARSAQSSACRTTSGWCCTPRPSATTDVTARAASASTCRSTCELPRRARRRRTSWCSARTLISGTLEIPDSRRRLRPRRLGLPRRQRAVLAATSWSPTTRR